MKPVRAAVIGAGSFGRNHARVIHQLEGVELAAIVDCDPEKAQQLAAEFESKPFTNINDVIGPVDAAIVATPTITHEKIATQLIEAGIDVLVEKPIAESSSAGERLAILARDRHRILQIGHLERFNPAITALQSALTIPLFFEVHRLSVFSPRSLDIDVVLDLMIHDLDLLLTLVQAPVRSIEAVGMSCYGGHEDLANARIHFANGCVAEITASRASPTPARQMQLWGPEGFAEVDFASRKLTLVQPSEQVRRHGLHPARLDPASRARIREELFSRHLEMLTIEGKAQDQLTCELQNFVDSVRTGQTPRVSGKDALAAMGVAEQILTAIKAHRWDGSAAGPQGPFELPAPCGLLFPHRVEQEVA